LSSSAVSLEFIGRRLDAVQNDVADVRRRMGTLTDRFDGLEGRMSTIEKRQGTLEMRIDALVERISSLETITHRGNALLERIAAKVGAEET
jgi:chromosome segregation ATPase